MNKKFWLGGAIFFFFIAVGVFAISLNSDSDLAQSPIQNVDQDTYSPSSFSNTHPLVFYDEDLFYVGVQQASRQTRAIDYHIRGGIVPHHLLPSFILSDFFEQISKQNPKRIILLGPNHYEAGSTNPLSSLFGWETPFGVVAPSQLAIQALEDSGLIQIDEKVVSNDHSIAGIMPYIKYYLPNTEVIPILLSSFMSESEVFSLSNNLNEYLDEDTIIVAAVDFSHYLITDEANQRDNVTLGLMEDFEYSRLLSLNDEYLDGATSIVTLLMLMDAQNTTKMDILYHANSGELFNNPTAETTSYFSILYY